MKSVFFGIAALSLAQTAAIQCARADDGGQLSLVTGAINLDGTSQFTTNAFKSSHLGTGHYLITFGAFGNKVPICIVVPLAAPPAVANGLRVNNSPSHCEIFISNAATGAAADAIFVFTASPVTGNVELH